MLIITYVTCMVKLFPNHKSRREKRDPFYLVEGWLFSPEIETLLNWCTLEYQLLLDHKILLLAYLAVMIKKLTLTGWHNMFKPLRDSDTPHLPRASLVHHRSHASPQRFFHPSNSDAPRLSWVPSIPKTSIPYKATTTIDHFWSPPTITQPDLPPRS